MPIRSVPRRGHLQWRRSALLIAGAAALWSLHPAKSRADTCLPLLPCTTSVSTSTTTSLVTTPTTTAVAAPVAPPTTVPAAGVYTGGAYQLLDLVNQARAQAGVGSLVMRDDIVSIAVGHSQDMARQHLLFHNDSYFTSAVRSSLGAGALGENVDMNFNIPAVHAAFMNSPHHLANIVDPRFTAAGIGVVIDSAGDYWVTEDFAQVKGGAPAPARTVPRTAPPPARATPRKLQPAASPATSAAAPATSTTAVTEEAAPAPSADLGGSLAALAAPPSDEAMTMRHTGGLLVLMPWLAALMLLVVAGGGVGAARRN